MKFWSSGVFAVLFTVGAVFSGAEPPAGYYNAAEGKTGNALKSALNAIISGHTVIGYDSAKAAMWSSIDQVSGKGVLCRYLGVWRNTSSPDTLDTNTEHTWPQSLGADVSPKRSDIHHLFIVDSGMNSRRGNTPYGYVSQADYEDGGTKIDYNVRTEPRDDFKGDVARALMYMDVRYAEMELVNSGEAVGYNKMGYLDDLLLWHQLDPVSDTERARNDAIYALQRNRNPFVDRPEFVALVYQGAQLPTGTPTMTPSPTPTLTLTPTPRATSTPTPTPGLALCIVYLAGGKSLSAVRQGLGCRVWKKASQFCKSC